MYTVHYRKGNPVDGIETIDDAILEIQEEMREYGRVKIIMEPGDGTRYGIFMINDGDTLLLGYTGYSNFFVELPQFPVVPGYIQEKVSFSINSFTLHLIAEIVRRYFRGEGEFYYNFDTPQENQPWM